MIGYCINNPKFKKILKVGHQLIDSTQDELIPVSIEEARSKPKPDFYYQNGLKKQNRTDNSGYIFTEQQLKNYNIPILIRESAVIRDLNKHPDQPDKFAHLRLKKYKTSYVRFSWNSFYMDEGLHPYDPTYDRWSELQKKHSLIIRQWQRNGDSILINMQEFKDASLNRLQYNGIEYPDFMISKIKEIRTVTQRPIIIRTHPLNDHAHNYIQKNLPNIKNLRFSKGRTLQEDFARAFCCVVYNSTSSVESVMHGLPTFTLDPSAVAYEVSNHNLMEIENPIIEYDRSEWLKKIAFMNWTLNELEDNYVWNLMKELIKK